MRGTLLFLLILALVVLVATQVPADNNKNSFKADLAGTQEVPSLSTAAGGEFRASLGPGDSSLDYTLSYSDLEGDVLQAHIHLGQAGVNGGISVFLCQTGSFPDPTGFAPNCPQSGSVSGTLSAANIIGPGGQGIAAGEFTELVRSIRSGVTYVNVHSSKFPGGEVRGQVK